jgi:AraC-like DNA-binding protein
MKILAIAVLLFTGWHAASGQGAKYIIRNYDLLSEINLNGSTWSMVQDTNGVLYFGADYGIAIYNGSFWEMSSGSQSIVRSLYYDSRRRIAYGGFDDFGFLERDLSRGIVFKSLARQLPDTLKVFGDIWSITESGNQLFFQSKNRIFVLDDGNLRSFRVDDCYHRGFIMGGSFVINQAGTGLTGFNGNSFSPVSGGGAFRDKIISCAIERPDKKILVGCRQDGFYLFDPSDGSIKDPFPGFPATNKELAANKIYHGIMLPDGNLAVATLSGGTYLLGLDGRILKILNRNHGLRDNVNYFLGLSQENNLWICTSNGISSFNINSPFILWDYTSGIDGVVLDIIEYHDKVYVGTLTGLYEIPGNLKDQALFQQGARCLLKSEVWSLARVNEGGKEHLLIGTGTGLYQLDDAVPALSGSSDLILKLMPLPGNPGVLLALHADNLDVYRWQGSRFQFERRIGGMFNGLRTAAIDDKENLWIGTRNAGVVSLPINRLLQGGSPQIPPVANPFGSILTDVIEYQGQVVFSNRDGLFSFNYSTGSFEKCQLFGPEVANAKRMISTLKKDSRGNIWLGGEDILLARPDGSYTIDKLNFQQLKDVFSAFVFLHTADQKTWIGGNNGVYLNDSRISLQLPANLQTIINRIEVHQDSTLYLNAPSPEQADPDFLTGKNRNVLEIDLAKRNGQVTFTYSLPFFENERNTLFSYKLAGYQEEWSPWSPETQVTFSNLRPSSYSFQVKGKTIYNQISQPAEVRFAVPKPWYLTNVSIVLQVLALGFIVYLIARYFSRVSVRKHLRIEDIIRKRIQESNRSQILNLLTANPGQFSEQAALAGLVGQNTDSNSYLESKENQLLVKALKIMETNMGNHKLTAGLFCKELGMSQAKVYRKLISLTGMSINQFIRNIRLKKAAQLLIETDLPISEIAYNTGFSSPGYFTKCFTAEFGQNPRDFSHKKHHGANL